MSNNDLRYVLKITFKEEETCPICQNIVHIDARNEAQANQLIGTIQTHITKTENQLERFMSFRLIRPIFWGIFALLCIQSLFSLMLTDYNVNFSILITTIVYGLVYITTALSYFIIKKRQGIKLLKNAIEEITKVTI